jgi:signal transduction histidine kinase
VIDLVTRDEEAVTQLIRTLAFGVITGQSILERPADLAIASGQLARHRDLEARLRVAASGSFGPITSATLDDAKTNELQQVLQDGVDGKDVSVDQLIGETGTAIITSRTALKRQITDELNGKADAVRAQAAADRDDASSRQNLTLVLTGGALLLAVGVTLIASRSITKPLHRLSVDAEEMARVRLPHTVQSILDTPLGEDVELPELVAIDASGGFEIAELAGALNTVQSSAAELAVEQAMLRRNISDSFVNLGRRNQNLLSRQLDGITELERSEGDPDQLEKLFAIDHLATRMRRNAESLLLLAGLEPHRQWSAPVAIIDVVRGALGEVQDYDRVDMRTLDEAFINGANAADLTHLVAELLENALNYSPPGRDVELHGRRTATGYKLAVVDHGIGMSADEIVQRNVRLAGRESFTVAPSKYLGHYVVGRQAVRMGISVHLEETPAGGVTAVIDCTNVLNEVVDGVAAAQDHVVDPAVIPEAPAPVDTPSAPVAEAPAPAVETPSPAAPGAPVETTASGYTKRVRGANTPRTDVAPARAGATEAVAATSDVRSALSGLQSGQDQARSDLAAGVAPPPVAPAEEPAPVETTASGYTKRVRGANTPRTDVTPARTNGSDPVGAGAPAEGLRSALSGLQAGQDRARLSSTDNNQDN